MNYRDELKDWLDRDDWTDWYALTLTMCQYRKLPNGSFEKLDETRASRNLRYFLARLNRTYYGNAYRRKFARTDGKRIAVIPVLEYDSNYRIHYHLYIRKPNHVTGSRFRQSIVPTWMRTPWGLWSADISENPDSGWLNYITKQTTKDPNDVSGNRFGFENVDFENLWVAD